MVDLTALLYPHTCTVTRISAGTADAIGIPADTTTTISTTQRCRLEEGGTRELAGRYAIVIDESRLFLPSGSNVNEKDRISDIKKAGVTVEAGPFEVVGIKSTGDSIKSVSHHMVATIEEVSD